MIRAVEHLEPGRLRIDVTVELQWSDGAAEVRDDDVVEVPLHDGVVRDRVVLHQIFEVQPAAIHVTDAQREALREGSQADVVQGHRGVAVRRVHRRDPHLVVADLDVSVELLCEAEVGHLDVGAADLAMQVRQGGSRIPPDVRVDGGPAPKRTGRDAIEERERCARLDVAVDEGGLHAVEGRA